MIRPKHWILALALMTGIPAAKAQLTYYDADGFPLLGKAAERTETRYERLPAEYKQISRGPVWELGKCTAGLALRFRSNSTTIAARWTALFDRTMNHQTQTGTRGLDLYCLQEDGAWTFVNSARPTGQKNETVIITDMEPAEREYMLYLPLYDGILDLEIGIDSLARIGQPAVDLPQRERPVVFYGTSILQGGCANRPGMAHTSIISRRLNRECINLGFSGNALLDLEIARLMAEVDAAVFVLDFVPNASVEEMNDRMETFYRILRDRHPDTPVIFIAPENDRNEGFVHRNIRIENNRFELIGIPAISAKSVEGLKINNNLFQERKATTLEQLITTTDCTQVEIENNRQEVKQ